MNQRIGWIVGFIFSMTGSLVALDLDPWLPPPLEFKGNLSYVYDKSDSVQSPLGSFPYLSIDSTFAAGIGVSPWPNWHIAVELLLTKTEGTPFYQATFAQLRYQWWDDVKGDPITVTTGLSLSFPGKGYLQNFSYAYHGNVNAEFQLILGKEHSKDPEDWDVRFWTLFGAGIADRGNGWLHGLATLSFQPSCFEWGLFIDAVAGLGSQDIIPWMPFTGYGYIAHRMTELGSYLSYPIGVWGTLSLLGWYEVYARNFMAHDWGIGASLSIPFSF